MDLDLDRMLANARSGQWSVDDFDWTAPLAGADSLSRKERREAGLSLVFTAGLERQAARIFSLNAEFIDDPRAVEIYHLCAADEVRHAEAEMRLAARLGVGWDDLPVTVRWMFATLEKNFEQEDKTGVHELSSAAIVLFELALDSILIPALKDKIDDPLQAEVFRRIDIDESRHLAMDYWLLDRKGVQYGGRSADELFAAHRGHAPTLRERVVGRYKLTRTLVAFLIGFGSTTFMMPSMRKDLDDPDKIDKYLRRVAAVPKRAPHAMDVPMFRTGLRGQQIIMRLGQLLGRGSAAA